MTLNNCGMAVAPQVRDLDLCFQLKVIPKESTFPEAEGQRSKGSNVLLLHFGKPPQPTKTSGLLIQIEPIGADLVFAKNLKCLRFIPLWEKECACRSQAFGEHCWFPGGDQWLPRAACLLFRLLPLWQDAP